MLAKKKDEIILVFIEWKYVERYYEKSIKAKEKANYEVRKNKTRRYDNREGIK
jgi:hypothetical protein